MDSGESIGRAFLAQLVEQVPARRDEPLCRRFVPTCRELGELARITAERSARKEGDPR